MVCGGFVHIVEREGDSMCTQENRPLVFPLVFLSLWELLRHIHRLITFRENQSNYIATTLCHFIDLISG